MSTLLKKCQYYKTFYSLVTEGLNKLVFVPNKLLLSNLIFSGKVGRKVLCLATVDHSSLFGLFVNDEEIKFVVEYNGFSSSPTKGTKQSKVFVKGKLFRACLTFAGKVRSLTIE